MQPLIGTRAARVDEVEHAELIAAERQPTRAVALLARLFTQLAVDAQLELTHAHHLARHADALADEEIEQLLLDAGDPREPLARDAERAAKTRLERRVTHRELGDPAMVERDQHRRRGGVKRDRLRARRGQRAGVEQIAFHEQRDVLERGPRQWRRLDQRLLFELLGRCLLVRELHRAAFGELALGEHRRGDLTARDVDDWRGLATGEADRIEDEHVALDQPLRDPALRHRRDQILIRHALEQRQAADHRVVRLETGWYHRPAAQGPTRWGVVLNGQS